MKTLKITAIITVAAILLTGCGILASGSGALAGKDQSKNSASLDPTTVILDWTPNTNHTGLYVALEKGYYEEEGLDVDIVEPADGTAEVLVASGKGDFGVSYQENVTFALTGKDALPITSIAAVIQHNTSGFASPKEKGIESVADWAGKTYGGWGGAGEEPVLQYILDKNGVDRDSLNTYLLGDEDFFAATQNTIDFAWVFEADTLLQAKEQGIELNYLACRDIDPALDYYTPILITGNKLKNENPDKVRRFLAATSKGYAYAIEHPEESAEILLKYVPESDRDFVLASQKYLSPRYQDDAPEWGVQKADVWENYAKILYDAGLLESELKVDEAFTNEFLPER